MLKLKRSLLSTEDLIHYMKIMRGRVSVFLSVLHCIDLKQSDGLSRNKINSSYTILFFSMKLKKKCYKSDYHLTLLNLKLKLFNI